ncbi:MAG: hypothetical protein E6K70_05960, partial [Planctomycetota bacterium]
MDTDRPASTRSGHNPHWPAKWPSAWPPLTDGKWLTAGSQAFAQTIPVWQVATGKRVYELEGHQEGAGAVAFSPDSKIVASGGLDHTIRFWDLASGKELPRPAGHQGAVSAIAFSANGQMIVTGGRDKTIQVWEAA